MVRALLLGAGRSRSIASCLYVLCGSRLFRSVVELEGSRGGVAFEVLGSPKTAAWSWAKRNEDAEIIHWTLHDRCTMNLRGRSYFLIGMLLRVSLALVVFMTVCFSGGDCMTVLP